MAVTELKKVLPPVEGEPHPDLFTPERAAAYLTFESKRSFDEARRRLGIRGFRFGRAVRYSREQLDAMARLLTGRFDSRGR